MSERIGRYEIVRELGRGGQGAVYEAVLRGPGGFRRAVALKVLEGAGGLAHEARIGGWLRHPNLVDVFEVGEADGAAFCAMEYCPDGTVAEHLPMPDLAVVEVALQVCAALQYAHDALGLVHLDLKPQNLLLHGATVKVADLGIARARGFDHDGRVRGTRGYMAPELVRGGAVDARADVYALGVVLHELRTGFRAGASTTMSFDTMLARTAAQEGADASATTAIEDDEITVPVVQVDPICPAWLAPIVEKCTQADPADRYASMADLAVALQRAGVDGVGLAAHLGVEPRENTAPRERAAELTYGRERERESIRAALDAPGIVTLKGPAGVGKSHMARAAAADGNAGGVVFVAASEARELQELLRSVGAALDVALGSISAVTQVAQLGRVLAHRRVGLLVVDDLGAVAGAGAAFARWVAQAPELRLLITSRRALDVDGERIVEVGPLDAAGAVALVAARALERGVDVAGDPALPELVRRLDGLPLALELAAGRLGVLSPSDLLGRLDLALLRTAEGPERHSTLSEALDWSWEQLEEADRAALSELSVFQGGFTLEAAEAVIERNALDRIDTLMAHSLVAAEGQRFRLLEPVREYASMRLDDPIAAETRHGRYYARFGSDAWTDARNTSQGRASSDVVLAEQANLLVACRRALARGDGAVAAASARAAWHHYDDFGPYQAGAELCDAVLDSGLPDPAWRLRILLTSGVAWRLCGRTDRSLPRQEEAVRIARATGDGLLGRSLSNLATSHADRAEWDAVAPLLEEALAFARRSGPRSVERNVRSLLGNLCRVRGRYDEARAHDEVALALARAEGDSRLESSVLSNLGNLKRMVGRPEKACEWHLASLEVAAADRDLHALAIGWGNLAAALYDLGRMAEAREHLQGTLRHARNVGNRRAEAMALSNIGAVLQAEGRSEEALELCLSALVILEEVQYPQGVAATWLKIGTAQRELGRIDAALDSFTRAQRIAEESQLLQLLGDAWGMLAGIALRQGRLDDAQALCEQDLALRLQVGQPRKAGAARIMLGRIALARGARDEARRLLEEGAAAADGSDDGAGAWCLLAEMALDRGDTADARRAITRGRALWAGATLESRLAELERRVDAR